MQLIRLFRVISKNVRTLVGCIDKFLGNGSACRLRPGGSVVKSASRIFHCGPGPKGENLGRRPRAGAGSYGWEGSSKPPPHQLGSMGTAVSSPSGVRGRAPTAQRFSTIFSTQNVLSWHYRSYYCSLWTMMQLLRAKTLWPPLRTPLSTVSPSCSVSAAHHSSQVCFQPTQRRESTFSRGWCSWLHQQKPCQTLDLIKKCFPDAWLVSSDAPSVHLCA